MDSIEIIYDKCKPYCKKCGNYVWIEKSPPDVRDENGKRVMLAICATCNYVLEFKKATLKGEKIH
jgi:RNase P subunit RPR2